MTVCAAAMLAAGATARAAVEIRGAGSTFVAPIMLKKWIPAYERKHPNVKIDYQAIGSGAGIQDITSQTINFCGSDAPMTNSQLHHTPSPVLHFPEVAGPVVMSYNLPEIPSNKHVKLTGKVLANIYLGRIRHWDNSAIKHLNPNLNLPHLRILVVHRSDGSGTTYIFTGYLSAVSGRWKSKVGQSTSVRWPAPGGRGGNGSSGVAGVVNEIKGAIGYVEYAYVLANHSPYALMINRAGQPEKATIKGVVIAQAALVKHLPKDFRLPIINSPSKGAYPISGFTYLIIYKDMGYMKSHKEALTTVKFIHWILTKGQNYAKSMDYARLPTNMQKRLLAQLDTVTYNGKRLLK